MKVKYNLKGKSLLQLQKDGKFWYRWWGGELFAKEKGYRGEVIIDTDNLFLKNSNNKTLKEQKQMVKKLKVPKGYRAIIGNVATYAELAFTHFKKTGDRLFGEKYDYSYTRTVTPTSGSAVADVGYFHADNGLAVYDWHRVNGTGNLFAAPLVVKIGSGKLKNSKVRLIKAKKKIECKCPIGTIHKKSCPTWICPHCKGSKAIANPKGFCNHAYYPDYCKTCQKLEQAKKKVGKKVSKVKEKIRVGDWVKATKNCGYTKAGQIYQVVLDKKNGTGKKTRGDLAINPIDHNSQSHSACTEIRSWIKVKPTKKQSLKSKYLDAKRELAEVRKEEKKVYGKLSRALDKAYLARQKYEKSRTRI